MKTTPNNPEDENGLVYSIKVGSFIRLKRVKEMVKLIIRFCLVLQCYRALRQDIFSKVLYGYTFRGQGLSLRTTLLHCKDYIVAVAK